MKAAIKQAGYRYVKYIGNKEHILKDVETGIKEVWIANKNHANYGIKYKNTHLEFARTIHPTGGL